MQSSSTSLASWLKDLYDTWSKMRNKDLSPKWMRNLKLYSGEDIEKQFKTAGQAEDKIGWKSKTFIKIIKVKVMMAYSILVDVLLGSGQIPFKLSFDVFMRQIDQYDDNQLDDIIEQMTAQIRQWHLDTHADREMMKAIFSMVLYGEAWKKYTHFNIRRVFFQNNQKQVTWEEVPGHEYVSVWNLLWDMEVDDIRDGQGVMECKYISPYDLWVLTQEENVKKQYYENAIDSLISASKDSMGESTVSARDTDNLPPAFRDVLNRKRNIQHIEFWGRAPLVLVKDFLDQMKTVKDLEELTEMHDYIEDYHGEEVDIMAEFCICGQHEHIIRFDFNQLEKQPYRRCTLEQVLDGEVPSGVSDNLEDIQVSFNGMIRSFEDNKKLSANVILATLKNYLPPGAMQKIYEGKILELEKKDIDDIRKILQAIIIPDVGETLLSGIGLIRNLADLVSQLPSILQGEMLSKQKPDTAYEMSQLLEGAGKYLGQGVKNIDEMFIEDETKDLYEYLMLDPEYQGEKINAKVNAMGFQSYQDKVIKYDRVMRNLSMVLSSEVLVMEAKIRKHLEEIYKASDLDPNDFLNSDEEKQQIQQGQEQSRLKALEEQLQIMTEQARIDAMSKAEIEKIKGQEDVVIEMVKGDEERETSEQEFQQDIILQDLEADQDIAIEREKAKYQPQKPTK